MSSAGAGHSFRDTVRGGLVAAAVAAATAGNIGGGVPATVDGDVPAEAVRTTAVEGLVHDAGQFAEVASDAIRQRDEAGRKTEALPDDPPGEYRDAEPGLFGPEYMRDAEAFAEEGIDGQAVDLADAVDAVPGAGGDVAPDGLGGIA